MDWVLRYQMWVRLYFGGERVKKCAILLFLVIFGANPARAEGLVQAVPTPDGGQVPDAEIDDRGIIHLAYVKGGNVYYVRSDDEAKAFTKPLRVNTEANSILAPNMYRGPDLALGRQGQVHVIWYNNAYQRGLPHDQWGVQYSHLNAAGAAFVPSRNLNHKPSDNYSVAADGQGNVAVVWMADGLYVNLSHDDGATFSAPRQAPNADTCDCCASRAYFDKDGTLFVLYRDKRDNLRDMYLLVHSKDAEGFLRLRLSGSSWQIDGCPMTGASLTAGRTDELAAAWETKGRVYFARLDRKGRLQPPGEINGPMTNRLMKWPIALIAPDGSALLAWKSGDSLAWQRYDASGRPQGQLGSAKTNNPHRFAGVVTRSGNFLLFH